MPPKSSKVVVRPRRAFAAHDPAATPAAAPHNDSTPAAPR